MKITYGDGVEDALQAALRALSGLIVAVLAPGEEVPLDGSIGPNDVKVVGIEHDGLRVQGLDSAGEPVGILYTVRLEDIDRIHVY